MNAVGAHGSASRAYRQLSSIQAQGKLNLGKTIMVIDTYIAVGSEMVTGIEGMTIK